MTTTYTFNFSRLQDRIRDAHRQIMHEIQICARTLAEKDLPTINEDDFFPYIGSFISKYRQLKADAQMEIEASTSKAQGSIEVEAARAANEKLEEGIKDSNHATRNLRHRIEGIRLGYDWSKFPLIVLGIVALAGLEGFMATGVFEYLVSGNARSSKVMAIFFAIAMGVIAHGIATWLRNSPADRLRRRIKNTIIWMSVFFFSFACVRMLFLRDTDTVVELYLWLPFFFTAINLILFAGACYLSAYHLPSKQDGIERKEKAALEAQLAKEERNRQKLVAEQKKLLEDLQERNAGRISLIKKEEDVLLWIDLLREEATQCFISENINHRKSGVPECFKQSKVVES